MLTGPDVLNEASRLEFQLTGVGLVTVADYTLGLEVPAASGRQPPARRRGLDRWVEESLYAHAVGVGLLTTDVTDCHDRLDVYQHDEARWAPWPVHPDQLMLPLADDPTPDVCIADRRGRRERVQRRQGVWR